MLRKISKNYARNQVGFYSLDDLVPKDHMLRDIDKYVDFDFIYDLVEDLYDLVDGRPSIDPVMLIKLPILQYLMGIKSMRQTIKDCEVNMAYRWFLGLGMEDPIPHFTTFGKNYVRRFQKPEDAPEGDPDLFEQIFYGILAQAIDAGLVNSRQVFVDGTHIKAHANNHKYEKKEVTDESLFYIDELRKEIQEERVERQLKALKSLEETTAEVKEKKMSTTDPESGWFHKGEHKEVFAYAAQVACDEHGWALGFTVNPGNIHDSRAFKGIYDLLKSRYTLDMVVADAGYKTPAIAHLLMEDGVTAVFPYTRPRTKKGFVKKYDFEYNEEFDAYTCPEGQWIPYKTTTKDGYRQYKSDPKICINCPLLEICTQSKNHIKVLSRHIWQRDLDAFENLRKLGVVKEDYDKRKETIERLFGTAKENHGLRYTHQNGRAKMKVKLALTFACLNMKKLAKILKKRDEEVFLFWPLRAKNEENHGKWRKPTENFGGFVFGLSLAKQGFLSAR
jgi:transposase